MIHDQYWQNFLDDVKTYGSQYVSIKLGASKTAVEKWAEHGCNSTSGIMRIEMEYTKVSPDHIKVRELEVKVKELESTIRSSNKNDTVTLSTYNNDIEKVKSQCNLAIDSYSDKIKELETKLENAPKESVVRIPAFNGFANDKIIKKSHIKFADAIKLAALRIPILLVGPTGCGKSTLAEQIASTLELDYSTISCTAGMSESQLTGKLLPGEGGNFEYRQSPFISRFENGGVFLLDEIDAADPNVLVLLHSSIANGVLNIPDRKDNQSIKRHKDFILIAASNTFGTGSNRSYSGRNSLDRATLDRFSVGTVLLDYDKVLESELLPEGIFIWSQRVRNVIESNSLPYVLSTRFLIDASKMADNYNWTNTDIMDTFTRSWKQSDKAIMAGVQ